MVIDAWMISPGSRRSRSGNVRYLIGKTAIRGNKESIATSVQWKARPLKNVSVDLQSFLDHKHDLRLPVFSRGQALNSSMIDA
jgi:hypothetical protein